MLRPNVLATSALDFVHKSEHRADYSVKLDYNELPYSPAWLGSKDGECLHALNRYPEDDNQALIETIARTYRLSSNEIAVTHGIDEAVDRFVQLYQKHSFVLFTPTFFGFTDRLEANSANVRTHDLGENFKISTADIDGLSKTDVVILASPNNPTGHLFDDSEIERLLEAAHAVLVDETYIDFSSSAGWLSKRPNNLFVYISFSKSFGLAGLRAGFLVGPCDEMGKIKKKQWFCNMSAPVISAINQALNSDWHIQRANEIIQERGRVINRLRHMGFEVVETETNFILLKDPSGVVATTLDRQSIRVRPLTSMGMPDYLRISIDTPTNNNLLLQTLATIPTNYYTVLHGLHKLNQEWQEKSVFGTMCPHQASTWVTRKTG